MTYNPSAEEINILKHSLGVKTTIKDAYRNYYCAGPGHDNIVHLNNLVDNDFMTKEKYRFDEINHDKYIYEVTKKGKKLIKELYP